jgi:light-regulated signal transduction histidine kinase (bacteriophytochrome)
VVEVQALVTTHHHKYCGYEIDFSAYTGDDVVIIGYGLAITRQFVELMGGQIWFDSQVGLS